MALKSLFKVPKHQTYEYKPRYWNQKKEELQERLDRIEQIKNGDTTSAKARIAGGFRRGFEASGQGRRASVLKSNLMLLGIVVALLGMSYYFLIYYLPNILNLIEGNPGVGQ